MSALERILADFPPGGASARAEAAAAALRAAGLPERRQENWRYANLQALDAVRSFRAPPATAPGGASQAAAAIARALPAPLPGFARLLLVDGRLEGGTAPAVRELLARLRLPGAAPDPLDAYASAGDGRLGLISDMYAPEPLALRIAGEQSLEIIALATGQGAAHTAIELRLEPGAQLQLVERHLGGAGSGALACATLRIALGRHATLTHSRLQQTAADALFLDTLSVEVGEQARYLLNHIAAGGASTRSSAQLRLAGREASLQLRALAVAQGDQVCDTQFTVLHEAPGTRSDQLFRGVAGDRSRVACSGDVIVAGAAAGARVAQSLRGLIDGARAEVDLRPRLTINTDEIQATHGATTGRLDDDLLFYLLSRGLAPEAARSLLKWAFLGEALRAIEPPALRRAAEQATAARLVDAPSTELLQ